MVSVFMPNVVILSDVKVSVVAHKRYLWPMWKARRPYQNNSIWIRKI